MGSNLICETEDFKSRVSQQVDLVGSFQNLTKIE